MKADRERRVKAAARAIQAEARKLRKSGVALLTVLEVVREIQGHLTDIQEQAADQYHDEVLATEVAGEVEQFKDSPF